MGAVNEAAYVTAPIAGENICLSITDTVARFIIPAEFAGSPCTFVIEGTDADINFGGSSVTCVYGQVSTVGSEAITVHTSSGLHMNDGVKEYYTMPASNRATHFAVDSAGSGSGKLTISITGAR